MAQVAARIRERGEDAVDLTGPEDAAGSAAAIERLATAEDIAAMPLYGFLRGQDNIDAAGLPTTAACPDCAYLPGGRAGCRAAARRWLAADQQDHLTIRDRSREHSLARAC